MRAGEGFYGVKRLPIRVVKIPTASSVAGVNARFSRRSTSGLLPTIVKFARSRVRERGERVVDQSSYNHNPLRNSIHPGPGRILYSRTIKPAYIYVRQYARVSMNESLVELHSAK